MKVSKAIYGHVGVFLLLVALSFWSWQKWQSVWIERSEAFFPPEFGQVHDLEELAWRYPVYRSNDSYQWVAIANALAEGNRAPLALNSAEGPLETGRPNAWHSGLARYLASGGQWLARVNDWPTERGIGHFAHWAGSPLQFTALLIGALLLYRLAGSIAGLAFLALFFFSPAISWDFHFSRIDHESCLQIAVLLQVLGIVGCLSRGSIYWGVLAGVGSGLGWWIGATPQAIVGVVLLAAVILQLSRAKEASNAAALFAWGLSGCLTLLLLGSLDGRWSNIDGLSAWHPIYALAQLGCGLLAYSIVSKTTTGVLAALVLGGSPLLLLLLKGADAHIWLDPFMRRLHGFIVEFQSPLKNGLWKQWTTLGSVLCAALAIMGLLRGNLHYRRFLLGTVAGLLVLSLLQTRWLGLTTSLSVLSICLSLQTQHSWQRIATWSLALAFACSWLTAWVRIEEKPGKLFVADLFLQTGARDICLNLDYQLVREQQLDSVVALPFSFAPAAALFDTVHPLASFYWENDIGLKAASRLFATNDDTVAFQLCQQYQVSYLVVQRMQLGEPFAQLTQTALESKHATESTLAWRLAHGVRLPQWCEEVPFYGTFDPSRFSARIYRVKQPR